MSFDCDKFYKQESGENPLTAGFSGAAQGFAGLIGAGGFWQPTNSKALKNATSDYQKTQEQWQGIINEEKSQLAESIKEFANDQLEVMQLNIDLHEEIMSEQISENALIIQIVGAIVVIIIIYLAIL